MIARQFRGFTVAACLMVLAAFGMPDTSWAWESDGPRFNIYTQGYEKADVDEGGSYSKTETGVSAGYKWFTLAYKRSDFSWSHSDSVNFSKKGSPWDQLNKLTLDASFNGALGESVNWFAGGSIISGFEDQIWDSFTFAPRGGLTFSPTYDLKFHVGAAGLISPVRPLVMPIVGAEWRNEHDYGLSGIIGFPGTRVQYRFNDLLAARVAAKWDRDIYRLSNDSSVAGKGYVEESGYTGGAYLDITPIADLKLTVGAELLFDRQLRLYDKGGGRGPRARRGLAGQLQLLGYKRIQHGGAVPEHSLRAVLSFSRAQFFRWIWTVEIAFTGHAERRCGYFFPCSRDSFTEGRRFRPGSFVRPPGGGKALMPHAVAPFSPT